jgi:hypothetical protein
MMASIDGSCIGTHGRHHDSPTLAPVGTPRHQREQIRSTWSAWLEDVKPHVFQLLTHREIWTETRAAILEHAAKAPDTFVRHYSKLYVDAQTMAIRRLMLARAPDRRSLAKLIRSLCEHPDVITRETYAQMTESPDKSDRDYWLAAARETFDREFGDGGEDLSTKRLAEDLAEIERLCDRVVGFADLEVAHIVETARKETRLADPSWDELDAAIDLAQELFKRYALLVTGSSWYLPPVIQSNWHMTFSQALFPPPRHWIEVPPPD